MPVLRHGCKNGWPGSLFLQEEKKMKHLKVVLIAFSFVGLGFHALAYGQGGEDQEEKAFLEKIEKSIADLASPKVMVREKAATNSVGDP